MPSVSIRKNDQVRVIAGRDRGKEGRVLRVLADKGRALVENLNKIKRHTRPNPQRGIKGGVVEREASIHVSNLMLVCPECGKPSRTRRKAGEDGRSIRICKRCKEIVERKASA